MGSSRLSRDQIADVALLLALPGCNTREGYEAFIRRRLQEITQRDGEFLDILIAGYSHGNPIDTREYLSDILAGKRPMTLEFLSDAASILGKSLGELFPFNPSIPRSVYHAVHKAISGEEAPEELLTFFLCSYILPAEPLMTESQRAKYQGRIEGLTAKTIA